MDKRQVLRQPSAGHEVHGDAGLTREGSGTLHLDFAMDATLPTELTKFEWLRETDTGLGGAIDHGVPAATSRRSTP